MDVSGFWSFFLLLPIPFYILAFLVCILPSIYYYFDSHAKRKKQEQEYLEWSKRRDQQQKLEKMLRREYLIKGGYDVDELDFDDLRNLGKRADIDEEDYEITNIQIQGNFFADEVDEDEEDEKENLDEVEEEIKKIKEKIYNQEDILDDHKDSDLMTFNDDNDDGPKLLLLDDDE
jgi:hypothetical protein